ncbi:MAG: hydantoinase/oxoprolinase family protein [Alphaproteobacteria bacterium]|nr:hydantoinase/oxoprolinase family protein [Alphaproteobacteria bacterium]
MAGRTLIAADIGGTFTDLVLIMADGSVRTAKLPSTPNNYADAVLQGVRKLASDQAIAPDQLDAVLHACTVATNAILEGKGAKTALITTKGFRDVLELRRIRVPRLYDPLYVKPLPLVPRALRFEVEERIDARGEIVTPFNEADVAGIVDILERREIEAVAVCLINAYANGAHERAIGAFLRDALPDRHISLSSEVLPEIREYERTSTTVINAYVSPVVRSYLSALETSLADWGCADRLQVMLSDGSMANVETTKARPAHLVECGPAAGVIGAAKLGEAAEQRHILTLDMGGTTAKAALVENGSPAFAEDYEVGGGISLSGPLVMGAGYALRLPVIDVAEVGAGGGSIVRVDQGGALKVGPDSAGADPGPACYGRGGALPTVTDANLVLGYLNPEELAGGEVGIDAGAAEGAIEDRVAALLGQSTVEAAFGIHRLANATMARAIKTISTHRGRDPRDFTLYAFGGSGGIHAATLARTLGIKRIVIPSSAGVFSALGLLLADQEWRGSKAYLHPLEAAEPTVMAEVFDDLTAEAVAAMSAERANLKITRNAAMRFRGQAYELRVPIPPGLISDETTSGIDKAFRELHERTYGHGLQADVPTQIVALGVVARRATGTAPREVFGSDSIAFSSKPSTERLAYFGDRLGLMKTPVVDRSELDQKTSRGPLIIEAYDHAIVVPPNASVKLDTFHQVVLELDDGPGP